MSEMFRRYRKFERGEFILCFLDTAGEGSDWNAAQFLSKDRLDIPLVLHYEGSVVDATPALHNELEAIAERTGVKPVVCYETNNGGGYELERLQRLNRLQKYRIYQRYVLNPQGKLERTDKLGWYTNSATRPAMLNGVEELVNAHLVKLYDKHTVNEMFSFVKHKTQSGWRAEAEVNSHDDLIMALAGVWQMYQTEERPKEQTQQVVVDDVPAYAQFGIGQRLMDRGVPRR